MCGLVYVGQSDKHANHEQVLLFGQMSPDNEPLRLPNTRNRKSRRLMRTSAPSGLDECYRHVLQKEVGCPGANCRNPRPSDLLGPLQIYEFVSSAVAEGTRTPLSLRSLGYGAMTWISMRVN